MTEFNFDYGNIVQRVLDDSFLTKDQDLTDKLSTLFNQRFLLAYTKIVDSRKTIIIQFNSISSSITMQAVVMFLSMHGLSDWLIVKNYLVIDANTHGWARIETLINNI